MSATRVLLRQGTQHRAARFTLGFLGTQLRTSADGGGLAVRLGFADPKGRDVVVLAEGESATVRTGDVLTLSNIFFSPDGAQSAAVLIVTEQSDVDTSA